MAQFRTLSADDVGEILAAFGIGGYAGHQPIAVGTINTNLRVDTADGRFFVRINEGKSEDDVWREAAIVAHAAAQGVPTPVPRAASDGLAFARWRGEFVSVFPWVEGRTLARAELTPAHGTAVGAALAKLHHASVGFPDHAAGRYEPSEIDARLAQIAALARPELADAVAVLSPELDRLRQRERVGEVPLGIIHGDLFVDNVMFDDGGALTALIDFEQASWGRLVYDLAVTALAFGYGRDDFRPEIVRALCEAYTAGRSVSAAERAAFGGELRFVACRFAITRITDVHLKRDAGAPPGKNYQRYLDRLASVKKHLAANDGLFDLP